MDLEVLETVGSLAALEVQDRQVSLEIPVQMDSLVSNIIEMLGNGLLCHYWLFCVALDKFRNIIKTEKTKERIGYK